MDNHNFIQFVYHTKNLLKSNHQPRVTVVGKVDGAYLNLAVARCSKKDQFSRQKGREIATKRLEKGEFIAQINVIEIGINPSFHNFIECANVVAQVALEKGVHQKIAITLVPQPKKAIYKLL